MGVPGHLARRCACCRCDYRDEKRRACTAKGEAPRQHQGPDVIRPQRHAEQTRFHYRVMTPTVEEAEVLHAKAHKFLMWRMVLQQRVTYSDNTFAYVPEMATWLFNTFLVLEFLFLGVNLWTEAPFVFERCMPYHLAFSALCLGWWASVYVGLDLARYPGYLSRQRTAFGF